MNREFWKIIITLLLVMTTLILTVQCSSKYAHGERAYVKYCGDCHMEDGNGVGELYPSLLNSELSSNTQLLPCIIKHGYRDSTTVMQMNPVEGISDIDITNIINYLNADLLGNGNSIMIQEVEKVLENCGTNPVQ